MRTLLAVAFSIICCLYPAQSQKIYSWGDNQFGQLGTGDPSSNYVPTLISIDSNWVKVAVSVNKSFAVRSDGTLWAWGHNELGTLGDGTDSSRIVPKRIGNDSDWASVVSYQYHTIAIKRNGTLWGWGLNSFGSIGDGSTINRKAPVKIGTDSNWRTVSVGNFHTIALKKDSSLWAWGYNINGELGNGNNSHSYTPIRIGNANDWAMAVAGANHSAAIKRNGTLWTWGRNTYGALGDGTKINKNQPTQVGTSSDWQYVACSDNATFAIKTDGTLWAWGNNNNGKLGDGTIIDNLSPIKIGGESSWLKIFPGPNHTLAIKSNNTLWGWGLNNVYQIGDGTNVDKHSPVQIGVGNRWFIASAAFSHSAALYGLELYPEIDGISPTFNSLVCDNYDKKTFTVFNYGEEALVISGVVLTGANQSDFRLISPTLPQTLSPGDTTYFEVEFRPLSAGTKSASLKITSNALSEPIFNMKFTARKDSVVIKPDAKFFDLGVVCPGEDKVSNLKVSNQGTVYTAAFLTGSGNLYVTENKITLDSGKTRTLAIVFKKQDSEGIYRDTLVVADSSCGHIDTIFYQIKVQNTKFTTESTFIETKVGMPKDMTVKFINQSDRNIVIPKSPDINPPFSIVGVNFPITIPARATISFTVRFSPTTIGDFSQSVVVEGTPCQASSTLLLSGKAVDTELLLSAPSIDNLICESSSNFNVEIENVSDSKWTVSNLSLSGSDANQFSILEPFPFDIAPKSKKQIKMAFVPTSIGIKSAELNALSNATIASKIKAPLQAQKDSASMAMVESIVDLGTIIVETTRDSSINILNTGNLYNTAVLSGFDKFEFAGTKVSALPGETSKVNFHFAGSNQPIEINEVVELQDTICGRKSQVRIKLKVRDKDPEPEPPKEPKISASDYVQFMNLVCEDSTASYFNLSSIGDTILTVQSIELQGDDSSEFELEQIMLPFDINASESEAIAIYFKPTSTGVKTASIVIKSNAVNDSFIVIPLSALKDSVDFKVSVRGIDIDSVEINKTKDSLFTVTNTGTYAANFAITATSNITLANSNFTLLPNESRTVPFTFSGLPTVSSIAEQITVRETTCGDSAKVFVTGSTYEVIIDNPAECTFKVYPNAAKSGEKVEILVAIEDTKYFDYYKIDTVSIDLVYNSTVLSPSSCHYFKINDTLSYITLQFYADEIESGISTLFDVGLGNSEFSNLTLQNPKFDVPAAKVVTQIDSATFALLGLCTEGGVRLAQSTVAGGIVRVSPNPANGQVVISYSAIELGQTNMELYNIFGEKVATIFSKNIDKSDTYDILFDTRELSSGTYFIKYSSPTINGTERLIIKR